MLLFCTKILTALKLAGTTASEQEISPQNEMQKEKLLALMTKIATECAGFAVEAARKNSKHQVVVRSTDQHLVVDPSEVWMS